MPSNTSACPPFDRRAIPREAVEGRWSAPGGALLRRIDWLMPQGSCRGSILFMPGRGDAYEKYLETLDYWHRKGWRVTAADWRGQAGSGRLGNDSVTGHVDDFGIWVADLAAFWLQWRSTTPGPHVLVGHSMGGHLVLRALAEHKVEPDAAVLIAPMVDFIRHGIPAVLMHTFARAMSALCDARRPMPRPVCWHGRACWRR
jgi:lysophospholipase